MAKKKYSKEFILIRKAWHWSDVYIEYLNGHGARTFCASAFCRAFAIPPKFLRGRKHRVRITIEFLEELK